MAAEEGSDQMLHHMAALLAPPSQLGTRHLAQVPEEAAAPIPSEALVMEDMVIAREEQGQSGTGRKAERGDSTRSATLVEAVMKPVEGLPEMMSVKDIAGSREMRDDQGERGAEVQGGREERGGGMIVIGIERGIGIAIVGDIERGMTGIGGGRGMEIGIRIGKETGIGNGDDEYGYCSNEPVDLLHACTVWHPVIDVYVKNDLNSLQSTNIPTPAPALYNALPMIWLLRPGRRCRLYRSILLYCARSAISTDHQ